MKVEWTNTFTTDFDLDHAQQDFYDIMDCDPDKDPNTAIYDAVEANWACDWYIEEFGDTSPAIEQCAKALRERVGGVQMRMDLPPIPPLWWEDSVWKK